MYFKLYLDNTKMRDPGVYKIVRNFAHTKLCLIIKLNLTKKCKEISGKTKRNCKLLTITT